MLLVLFGAFLCFLGLLCFWFFVLFVRAKSFGKKMFNSVLITSFILLPKMQVSSIIWKDQKRLGGLFTKAKCKAEKKRLGNIMRRDSQKRDVFKFGKRVVKTVRIILVTMRKKQ